MQGRERRLGQRAHLQPEPGLVHTRDHRPQHGAAVQRERHHLAAHEARGRRTVGVPAGHGKQAGEAVVAHLHPRDAARRAYPGIQSGRESGVAALFGACHRGVVPTLQSATAWV